MGLMRGVKYLKNQNLNNPVDRNPAYVIFCGLFLESEFIS